MYSTNSCSGCNFSYSPSCSSKFYSHSNNSLNLEKTVEYSMLSNASGDSYSNICNFEQVVESIYDKNNYQGIKNKDAMLNSTDTKYFTNNQNFNPLSFLNPERPLATFITNIEELKPIITETFEKLMEQKFPNNVSIRVCSENELKKIHEKNGGLWTPTIQGFSLNRNGKGVNEIFVKQDALDSMMLTIGHELGHVMTPTLQNSIDEEAKAFAFSLAWVETIKEHNIANLAANVNTKPAKNGLHDRAFNFLIHILNQGKSAFQAFKEIAKGEFSSNQIINN